MDNLIFISYVVAQSICLLLSKACDDAVNKLVTRTTCSKQLCILALPGFSTSFPCANTSRAGACSSWAQAAPAPKGCHMSCWKQRWHLPSSEPQSDDPCLPHTCQHSTPKPKVHARTSLYAGLQQVCTCLPSKAGNLPFATLSFPDRSISKDSSSRLMGTCSPLASLLTSPSAQSKTPLGMGICPKVCKIAAFHLSRC